LNCLEWSKQHDECYFVGELRLQGGPGLIFIA
jgi:hypothetical protein